MPCGSCRPPGPSSGNPAGSCQATGRGFEKSLRGLRAAEPPVEVRRGAGGILALRRLIRGVVKGAHQEIAVRAGSLRDEVADDHGLVVIVDPVVVLVVVVL